MEQTILKILLSRVEVVMPPNVNFTPTAIKGLQPSSFEIAENFKAFLKWKDDVKCEFATCHNGIDKTRDRVCYEKGNKHYTIDEVYAYWLTHK